MRIPIYQQDYQKKKAENYPKDRICFLGTDAAAEQDKATFRAYQSGYITLHAACERIAEANMLEEVTEEQFLKAAKMLGYQRRVRNY